MSLTAKVISPPLESASPRPEFDSDFIGCERKWANLHWHHLPRAERCRAECHWRCDAFKCLSGLAESTGVLGVGFHEDL